VNEARGIVGPVPAGRDPDAYDRLRRRVLWSLPTGLYVVGTRAGDERNLMTISWVMQAALEPKLVAIGVEAEAVTHRLLAEGTVFAVSLLPRSERALVRRFAKPVHDADVDSSGTGTMLGQAVHAAATGAPILDVAAAWLDCELRHTLPLGSHSLFVGEVVDCGIGAPGPSDATSPTEPDRSGQNNEGPGHAAVEVLRMEDTRMNYGG